MGYERFKNNCFCVGQKHSSGTENIKVEITFDKKTGKEIEFLVGQCMICDRKKSKNVSDITLQAEGLGCFFKSLRKIPAKTGQK